MAVRDEGVSPLPGAREGMERPHVVLDTGGDRGSVLSAALYRCIDSMRSGQLLCVISHDGRNRDEIADWCVLDGHLLLDYREMGREAVFWIRKR